MTLIGQNSDDSGLINFYCKDENGFYYEMAVRNAGGALDMTFRVPRINREQFLNIAGDNLR